MDPEARNELILSRVQQVMAYAWDRSAFYRRKWSEAGIHPNDIRSLGDFEQVPPVTKRELRADQEAHPPFGSYLCIDEADVQHIHGTSGTTGRPTAFGIGKRDWVTIASAHARIMWAMGIRPSDTVFIASFFSLYMGSWGALIGAKKLGATVFPFGAGAPGQTRRAVRWLAEMRPTVLYSTPSYGMHLAETAADQGIDAKEFGLRLLFFSGEPGASIPSMRTRLTETFGADVFDSGSMAEVSPWMNLAETTGHTGMLCWQDVVYTEVADPETYRRVPFGAEGTPIYTTLERTSQPMIRLLSNDLTSWEAPPSPCGRTYPVLPRGIYGRVDDVFTVRGENVYPSAIDDVVMGLPHYGGEHRIVISRKDAMDELVVKVEVDDELVSAGSEALVRWQKQAEGELMAVLGVRTRVVDAAPGTFDRTQMKARRVIDNRDLWRSLTRSDRPGS
jgi:phenylacetate-CoA ligase